MQSENMSYHETINKMMTDPEFAMSNRNRVTGQWMASLGNNPKTSFRQVIPKEEIDSWLALETPLIRECFQEGEIDRIQNVGSTSVPGMCGMMTPDIGIFVNVFPPSEKTFANLHKLGYELSGFFTHIHKTFQDIWLFKRALQADSGKTGLSATIHIWKHGSPQAKGLIDYRDLMRTDKLVFDAYRNKKLELMNNQNISKEEFIKYKIDKGKVAQQHLKGKETQGQVSNQ